MNKIWGMFVVVMMMATQAGAATISGLGQSVQVEQGKVYTLFFDTGPVELVPNANLYIMRLTLPTGALNPTGGGLPYPIDNRFKFDWVFDSLGSTTLNVSAVLASYANVPLDEISSGTWLSFPNLFLLPSKSQSFSASRTFEVVAAGQIPVVPIGGTLPLMLSALGLMGWFAGRRRARSIP